jgi:galactose mutarotase-like enzyme
MAQTVIQNDTIRVTVDSHGAEMTSIQNAEGKEYLWDADPKYWKRHAPVLFPLVGSLKDGQYRLNGKTYFMGQHGFARDSEFQLLQASQTECWYRLTESEESLAVYPYPFTLDIGYRLGEQTVETIWRVTNSGTQPLYFSIGGHPAFLCPQTPEEQKSEYSLHFYQENPLTLSLLNQGLLAKQTMETQHGFAKIGQHLFDVGTLILEDDQVKKVALVNPDGVEYITVTYEAPVVGVWSGSKNDTPFVCIEPWYGLADADNFTGTWEERKWGNCLEAGQVFEGGFTIRIK